MDRRSIHGSSAFWALPMSILGLVGVVLGDTVELTSVKDNTLHETDDGSLSNGAGDGVYSGRTDVFADGKIRRALLSFDVAGNIPAGSTVTSVTLTLRLLNAQGEQQTHGLHRVLADWGEGDSIHFGGQGAPSEKGDATWLHTFYPDQFWDTLGGDFTAEPSATQEVAEILGPITWDSTDQLVADVQSWLDDPAGDFGWVILGNEKELGTAKKFASRQWPEEDIRPHLVIEFEPGNACIGDIDGDGVVGTTDLLTLLGAWGGGGPADLDGSGVVDTNDLIILLGAWGPCR